MIETGFIFGRTRVAIQDRLAQIDQSLLRNTGDMQKMDHDGDMMDDPLLFDLNEERVSLLVEQKRLKENLLDNEDLPDPAASETITLGHEVLVGVNYPDGFSERLQVTIGTDLDKKFLWDGSELRNEDHDRLLVSDDSPLGKTLLGKKVGDKAVYEAEGGNGSGYVEILGITISPFIEA